MDFGKPLPDMDDMSDFQLGDIAAICFRKGLEDGRSLSHPMSADKLTGWLPGYPHRIGHAKKLRQVYGAGFDIAQMMRSVRAKEARAGEARS